MGLALAMFQAAPVRSQDAYPARPIRLVVPFGPGSSTDITARRLEPHMSQTLGQQLVVENRAGAVGVIGSDYVKRAAPDGYTLLMTAVSSHSIAGALRPKTLPYDVVRDFTPIGRTFTTTGFILVHPSVQVRSLKELIGHSKTLPKGLSFASGGFGSSNHLLGEALKLHGANIVHIPYVNLGQAITDVVGGHVPMMIYTVAVVPHVRAGRLRALAVSSPQRHKQLPDIPTIAEQGFPGTGASGWSGFFGPAGLALPIRNRLYNALRDAINDPEIAKAYTAAGQEEGLMPPDEFRAFVERDLAMWTEVVRRAKLPTDVKDEN